MLDKKNTLFERDENGDLISREVDVIIDEQDEKQLKFKGEKIKIVPLMRGEIKKLLSSLSDDNDSDKDGELITKHCKEPSYTEEETKYLIPGLANVIVNTILYESGLDVLGKPKKKAIEEKEDEFGKNSTELN